MKLSGDLSQFIQSESRYSAPGQCGIELISINLLKVTQSTSWKRRLKNCSVFLKYLWSIDTKCCRKIDTAFILLFVKKPLNYKVFCLLVCLFWKYVCVHIHWSYWCIEMDAYTQDSEDGIFYFWVCSCNFTYIWRKLFITRKDYHL